MKRMAFYFRPAKSQVRGQEERAPLRINTRRCTIVACTPTDMLMVAPVIHRHPKYLALAAPLLLMAAQILVNLHAHTLDSSAPHKFTNSQVTHACLMCAAASSLGATAAPEQIEQSDAPEWARIGAAYSVDLPSRSGGCPFLGRAPPLVLG
ncbi:MAG: hypothetical protein K1X83_05210 [Oligoflexia bacterium]|nr:hypothetical protein [Oligoflexia bacterium]